MRAVSNWRFEPVFNVGNLLSVLLMLGGLIGVYINIREVQVRQEERLATIETRLDGLDTFYRSALAKLTDIQIDIATIRALYQRQTDESDDRNSGSYHYQPRP